MTALIPRRTMLASGLIAATGMPWAQEPRFASRPIRFIVNVPAGGQSDLAARAIVDAIGNSLGQPIVVENRPGANGTIGAEALARAPKDGHVIGIANQSSSVVAPLIMPTSYKLEDFQLLTPMYRGAMVLAVSRNLPVRNVREFVEYARQNGPVSYGSFGSASPGRLTMELLAAEAGIRVQNVNYKGEMQIAQDVLGGHLPVYIGGSTPVLEHNRSGNLRILAISLDERSPTLKEIPTFREQGFTSVVYTWFHGLALPAGTPRPIVDRWHALVTPILNSDKFKATLPADLAVKTTTPEEFTRIAQHDSQWIGRIIREKGIRADA